jgi:hypothetical protein
MTYRLVFDVGQQVPEIALGIAGAVVLIGVIAGGLLAFDATVQAWRRIAAATFILALILLFLEQSRTLFFPIGFAAIGTGVDLFRDRVEAFRRFTSPRGTIATVACAFLLVLVAGVGLSKFGAIDLANRLNAGQADVVEGPVTDSVEVPTGQECFSVQGRRFCYADTVASPGFHRTRAYGGPINPGLTVRVAAIGDTIVRLEVGEP